MDWGHGVDTILQKNNQASPSHDKVNERMVRLMPGCVFLGIAN